MGYLVCYSCGGYYQLQPGESSHQYKKCCCGGKLKYYHEIEVPNHKNRDKVGVLRKKIKPKGYHERPQEILNEKVRLSMVMEGLSGSVTGNTQINWDLKNRILFDGLTFIALSILFFWASYFSFLFPIMAMAIIASSSILIVISQNEVYKRNQLQVFYLFNGIIFGLCCLISILFIILTILRLDPIIFNIIDYSYFSSTSYFSPITLALISGFLSYWSFYRAALPDYDEKPPLGTEPAWRGG